MILTSTVAQPPLASIGSQSCCLLDHRLHSKSQPHLPSTLQTRQWHVVSGQDRGMQTPFRAAAISTRTVAAAATAVIVSLATSTGGMVAKRKSRAPELVMAPTDTNKALLARCPSLTAVYKCFPFLSNGHVETIFAAFFRRSPQVKYYRRCLRMSDGGTVALDYEMLDPKEELPDDAPLLVVLPGLTGGSHDTYVQHTVVRARQSGIRAVVFNSRGTSDSPVTTPQFYSASFTGDMRAVVAHLRQAHPRSTMLAAGYSLGANILVRYLGEEGDATPLAAAASLCNPFDLVLADENWRVGFNKVYDRNLARSLRGIYAEHATLFQNLGGDFRPDVAAAANTIREFDDAITRVSFGWPSVDAYYAGSSSSLSIPHVTIPLLCIQAEDDPIAPAAGIPKEAIRENPNCILAVTPCGGHLGWVSGPTAPFGGPWTDTPLMEYLHAVLQALPSRDVAAPAPDPAVAMANGVENGAHSNGAGAKAPAAQQVHVSSTAGTEIVTDT